MVLLVSDLIAKARRFATEAHARIEQRRKYTQQPYQVHLKSVAELVAGVTSDPEMIAAAWLHDTVGTRRRPSGTWSGSSGRRSPGWSRTLRT
jgi:(p)ppGpp synthase/HD superfamily hydrolase